MFPYPLIEAFAEGLRETLPFKDLPARNRPTGTIFTAQNNTNLGLRLPLYHERLGKKRPKSTIYDNVLQEALAVLASFAKAAGTRQAIVRIRDGQRQAISFQPRPFSANWSARHAISPPALQDNRTDPMHLIELASASDDTHPMPASMSAEVSTRGVIHLAGKAALCLMHSVNGEETDGHVTFVFDNRWLTPRCHAVWRPLRSNMAAHAVDLVHE